MYLAKLKVEQGSCSLAVATSNDRFAMDILGYILLNPQDALFLVKITKCDGEINECLKTIESHPSTIHLQLIEKKGSNLDFLAVIRDTTGIKAFEESYCFIKPPIKVEKGNKVYTIIVPEISNLKKAYEKLKNVGKWSILDLIPIYERENILTETQKKILKVAWNMGYFSERRNAKINDISQALGIAKSTAHKHLRKAISKIVESYVKDFQKSVEL